MAIYYYDSTATAGGNTGANWANARLSLATMTGGAGTVVAGDTLYVAHTHDEKPGAALTITLPGTVANPNQVLCVRKDGSVPPIWSDWATSAKVGTTGTFNFSLIGSAYIQGITFDVGQTSTGLVTLSIVQATGGVTGNWQHFENCVLRISSTSTNTGCRVVIGSSGTNVGCRCTLTNTAFHFTNAANNIQFASGQIEWRATPNAFLNLAPTSVAIAYGTPFSLVCEGVDFYQLAGRNFFTAVSTYFRAAFYGCEIPSNCTMVPAAGIGHVSAEVYISNSGPAVAPFISLETRYGFEGIESTNTTIARAGGATDGVLPFSRFYTVYSTIVPFRPYTGVPFVKWNDTALSDLTLTVYGVWNSGTTTPLNKDMWLEAHYFADVFAANRSPLMDIEHSGKKPNFQAANTSWTADGSDWTVGTVPIRLDNSSIYTSAAASAIKVPTNTGRVFFCIAGTGPTAATIPAAYETAVDGTVVADGGYNFRAGMRFKMTVTLDAPQVQLPGPVYVFPKVAFWSTVPFLWLDPVIG